MALIRVQQLMAQPDGTFVATVLREGETDPVEVSLNTAQAALVMVALERAAAEYGWNIAAAGDFSVPDAIPVELDIEQ